MVSTDKLVNGEHINNKKTARRAENPARPQILLGAYRTPTRYAVYDLSVSFKAIANSGVESIYNIQS